MRALFDKLYIRIWLAVVVTVGVLTMLVGWVWRMSAEPQPRTMVVYSHTGQVIGNGVPHQARKAASDATAEPPADDATAQAADSAIPVAQNGASEATAPGRESQAPGRSARTRTPRFSPLGSGPEFVVQMKEGPVLHVHLPRTPQRSWSAPLGFFWTIGLVALGVALATYPIVRRLTRRLEALQRGVEQWGEGNLGARIAVAGSDEVGFLAARFNRAAAQVEGLITTRDGLLASQKSLLANASHELRSPLARIRMGLELLGPSANAVAKDEIARNISELDLLIEEILLASRLDAQQADLGTVEPVDLVGLAAEECAWGKAELHVEAAAGDLVVPGVAKLLRRCVRNLLENAHRYAKGDVTVTLSVESTNSSKGYAVICVGDRGPGIAPEQQARIFEAFYRLPGASESSGGVGLGLALVKSIAQRHGGSVVCGNRVGGGAEFQIRLPI